MGSLLRDSGIKKATLALLNQFGLTVSPRAQLLKLHEMTHAYDRKVLQWKAQAESSCTGEVKTTTHLHGFQIVGDNIDISKSTKVMTATKTNQLFHWFHVVAVRERVDTLNPVVTKRSKLSILSVDSRKFLLSLEEMASLREEFVVLVSRMIVDNLKNFATLKSAVCRHIAHEHSSDMSKKSEFVPLGLLDKNENLVAEMMDILKYVRNNYVPYKDGQPVFNVQFTGDQLTAERSRSALASLADSSSSFDRVEGLVTHAEDFHCSMNFVDLIFKRYFQEGAGCNDPGTLKHLKALLGRKNVSSNPMHNYTPCSTFVEDVLTSYVVAYAIKFFNLRDNATKNVLDEVPEAERQSWFLQSVEKIVDEFLFKKLMLDFQNCTAEGTSTQVTEWASSETNSSIFLAGKRTSHDYATCESDSHSTEASDHTYNAKCTVTGEDEALEYARNFCTAALIETDFKDAVKESDGPRLLRCWKAKMVLFKDARRHKYALEGFYFLADQLALLNGRDAHRQLWNRGFNTNGGIGKTYL